MPPRKLNVLLEAFVFFSHPVSFRIRKWLRCTCVVSSINNQVCFIQGWNEFGGDMIIHPFKRIYRLGVSTISVITMIITSAIAYADADRILRENSKAVVVVVAYDEKDDPIGQGSGFIVREDGAVVTNYHVISNARNIRVKAGKKVLKVEGLIYADMENDVVILKVTGKSLPTVRLGDVEKMDTGEKIYVIGSPEGLENTISDGILTGIRQIDAKRRILQITAPISRGSSGSPVFNKSGEVIGIATFLIKEAQNLNFAVPVTLIKDNIQSEKVVVLDDAVTEDYKKTAKYWFTLGIAYSDSEMFREAIEAFKQAVRINPEYEKAHYNLGTAYGKSGMLKEAIEGFKEAIRINPDDAHACYNLGYVYVKSGMYKESIEAFKQAIRLKPDFAEAHYNLGIVHLKLNDRGSALDEYRILKDIDSQRANNLFNFIYSSSPY